jgi:hypothetical protein
MAVRKRAVLTTASIHLVHTYIDERLSLESDRWAVVRVSVNHQQLSQKFTLLNGNRCLKEVQYAVKVSDLSLGTSTQDAP